MFQLIFMLLTLMMLIERKKSQTKKLKRMKTLLLMLQPTTGLKHYLTLMTTTKTKFNTILNPDLNMNLQTRSIPCQEPHVLLLHQVHLQVQQSPRLQSPPPQAPLFKKEFNVITVYGNAWTKETWNITSTFGIEIQKRKY